MVRDDASIPFTRSGLKIRSENQAFLSLTKQHFPLALFLFRRFPLAKVWKSSNKVLCGCVQGKSHLAALFDSPFYFNYQRAFTRGTGLPLTLHLALNPLVPTLVTRILTRCLRLQNA
jgi:hypothetical protein